MMYLGGVNIEAYCPPETSQMCYKFPLAEKLLCEESNQIFLVPGLTTFLDMVTVNSVGGADPCIVLWCQVKVLKTLQTDGNIYNKKA